MSNYKQKYYKYKYKYLLTKPSVKTHQFGGTISLTPTRVVFSANEIIDKFYLCTQSRHNKPITDFLRPFGSFDELDELYPEDSHHIKKLEEKKSNPIIVGSSQYGLFFRLVKKKKKKTCS